MSQIQEILRELIYQNEIIKSSIESLKRSPTETFFQFGSPLIVVLIATTSSYFSGRYFFKKEYEKSIKLKEADKKIKEFELTKNYEKEIEFKRIEFENKERHDLKNIYMEANKYQQSLIYAIATSQRLLITFEGLAAKYRISKTNSEYALKTKEQMDENKKDFMVFNQLHLDELKNYIAALASYKFLKNGETKITEHLNKIKSGVGYKINPDIRTATTIEQIDELTKHEKEKFTLYWQKEFRDETKKALDVILKNE